MEKKSIDQVISEIKVEMNEVLYIAYSGDCDKNQISKLLQLSSLYKSWIISLGGDYN